MPFIDTISPTAHQSVQQQSEAVEISLRTAGSSNAINMSSRSKVNDRNRIDNRMLRQTAHTQAQRQTGTDTGTDTDTGTGTGADKDTDTDTDTDTGTETDRYRHRHRNRRRHRHGHRHTGTDRDKDTDTDRDTGTDTGTGTDRETDRYRHRQYSHGLLGVSRLQKHKCCYIFMPSCHVFILLLSDREEVSFRSEVQKKTPPDKVATIKQLLTHLIPCYETFLYSFMLVFQTSADLRNTQILTVF